MDAKVGVIFGCVLAVVLLILCAMNMGNISSVQRDIRKVADARSAQADEAAKLSERLGQIEDDLADVRRKIARLETQSVGVEGAAEAAARKAAKSYLDAQRDNIVNSAVEKAVGRIDLGRMDRDIAALRASLAKMQPGAPKAEAPAARPGGGVEEGVRELAKRAAEEAGVEVTEDQQKKTADAIGKGIGDFMELMQRRRNGDITEEEFRQQAQELRERTRREVEGNFTPEQLEEIRERLRNRRRPGGEGDGAAPEAENF